jgi:hypothetical protein
MTALCIPREARCREGTVAVLIGGRPENLGQRMVVTTAFKRMTCMARALRLSRHWLKSGVVSKVQNPVLLATWWLHEPQKQQSPTG